ncbi:hypothetical protein M3J09_009419 [Ascochyta lentis]
MRELSSSHCIPQPTAAPLIRPVEPISGQRSAAASKQRRLAADVYIRLSRATLPLPCQSGHLTRLDRECRGRASRLLSECLTALRAPPPVYSAPAREFTAGRHSSPLKRRFRWWLSGYPGDHGSNRTLQLVARSQDAQLPCRASAVEAHRSAASRPTP